MSKFAKYFCGILVLFAAIQAQASTKEAFSNDRFKVLQAADEVILIDVYASWCPTCAKQQSIIEQYAKLHPNHKFHILVVDFDQDKSVVRQFNAPRQSTLILYKGKKQMWFAVAETRAEIITAALDQMYGSVSKP